MEATDDTIKKYSVRRTINYWKGMEKVFEDYGDMTIDELKDFLTQFIGDDGDGYVYDNQQELDNDIEYIKKYGDESLTAWDNYYTYGGIDIKEIVE